MERRSSGSGSWWTTAVVAAALAVGGTLLIGRGVFHRASDVGGDFPFPCLPTEGEQQHIHPYLRIIISGQSILIPAFVGIRELSGRGDCLEPLHTHDASGIIHIESPSPTQLYTLADFFAIWRATYETVDIGGANSPVNYALTDLLGFRVDAQHALRLLVDGTPSPAGPSLVLNSLDYCSAPMTGPPCEPTAVADPFPPLLFQQYGTGHTIVLQYGP